MFRVTFCLLEEGCEVSTTSWPPHVRENVYKDANAQSLEVGNCRTRLFLAMHAGGEALTQLLLLYMPNLIT